MNATCGNRVVAAGHPRGVPLRGTECVVVVEQRGGVPMGEPTGGLGATRDELRRLLGEPTDTSVPTRREWRPMIWRYGEVEYHFGPDGRVSLVYTEDGDRNPRVLGQLAGD